MNRNGKVRVYRSERLTALVKALPDREPTLIGKGSIAHTQDTPKEYTLSNCKSGNYDYHSIVDSKNALMQDDRFSPTYAPRIGKELFWCAECRHWVVTGRQYVPKPSEPRKDSGQIVKPDAIPSRIDHIEAFGRVIRTTGDLK